MTESYPLGPARSAPARIPAGHRPPDAARPIRVIAVTSGKGGVGKTTVAINLSTAIASLGKGVTLMDADLGLANVDVMLGLKPVLNLSHVLDGLCSLEDVVVTGPGGINLVPAASGLRRMTMLSKAEHAGLVYAFSGLSDVTDVLVIDTGTGMSDTVATFCSAAQEIILVVTNDRASITDAYATMRILNHDFGRSRFRLLANRCRHPKDGADLFHELLMMTDRLTGVTIEPIGTIPYDARLQHPAAAAGAHCHRYPGSPVAAAFRQLALDIERWPAPTNLSGGLEFFVERIVRSGVTDPRSRL